MEKVLVSVYLNDLKDYAGMNEMFLGRFGKEPGVRTTIAAGVFQGTRWSRSTASPYLRSGMDASCAADLFHGRGGGGSRASAPSRPAFRADPASKDTPKIRLGVAASDAADRRLAQTASAMSSPAGRGCRGRRRHPRPDRAA